MTPDIHADLNGVSCSRARTSSTPASSTRTSWSRARRSTGSEFLGPTRGDYHWQARERGTGFDAQHFAIDWEHERATCPVRDAQASAGRPRSTRTNAVITGQVLGQGLPPLRLPRPVLPLPEEVSPADPHDPATGAVRGLARSPAREQNRGIRDGVCRRAGIEGTLSRGVRTCRLRRTRYIGQAHPPRPYLYRRRPQLLAPRRMVRATPPAPRRGARPSPPYGRRIATMVQPISPVISNLPMNHIPIAVYSPHRPRSPPCSTTCATATALTSIPHPDPSPQSTDN